MKRVTLFCGHYGSGKSNLAVNYALWLKGQGKPVTLADMDIVNPYFRSADDRQRLEAAGVGVIALPFANSNVDLPALPPALYGLVQRRDLMAVLDVGGDDRGATALGRYVPYLKEEGDYDMLCVVNFYRPLTRTVDEVLAVMEEIRQIAGLDFTGLVNNSNLGRETLPTDVEQTVPLMENLSVRTGLPVVWTSYDRNLLVSPSVPNPFPMDLQKNNPAF